MILQVGEARDASGKVVQAVRQRKSPLVGRVRLNVARIVWGHWSQRYLAPADRECTLDTTSQYFNPDPFDLSQGHAVTYCRW
jgi:hypothetical protein